jgi:hypothetical protein
MGSFTKRIKAAVRRVTSDDADDRVTPLLPPRPVRFVDPDPPRAAVQAAVLLEAFFAGQQRSPISRDPKGTDAEWADCAAAWLSGLTWTWPQRKVYVA